MAALLALLLLLPPTGPAAASPGGDPLGTPEVPPGPTEPPQDLRDAAYQARCAAPPAPGPCRASFQRWFHSPGGGGCRPFTYGGCGGNANNYARRQDCLRSCQRPAPGTEPAVQPTIALALLLLPLLLLLGGVAAALARRRFLGCAPPGLGHGPPTPDKEALVGAVGPM